MDEITIEGRVLEEKLNVAQKQLDRAQKLVVGLSYEGERWKQLEYYYKIQIQNLTGNAFLTAAFFAYLGPFNLSTRKKLVQKWLENIIKIQVYIEVNWKLEAFYSSEGEI